MRKSIMALLLGVVALLAVAATPAFAIEKAGSPVYFSGRPAGNPLLSSAGLIKGGGVSPDLCEYEACGTESAITYATEWADRFWGEPIDGEYCKGPFGNGKTRGETQWACYGYEWKDGGFHWQVNVDPWGDETYANPEP